MSPSVDVAQRLVLLAEPVGRRHQLDAAGAVLEVEERRLAHAAAAEHAPGEAVVRAGRAAGLEILVRGEHVGDRACDRRSGGAGRPCEREPTAP